MLSARREGCTPFHGRKLFHLVNLVTSFLQRYAPYSSPSRMYVRSVRPTKQNQCGNRVVRVTHLGEFLIALLAVDQLRAINTSWPHWLAVSPCRWLEPDSRIDAPPPPS